MKEKHVIDFEFWNCVVTNCASKFIRRDYLFKHLEQIHTFPVDDARKAALKATRYWKRLLWRSGWWWHRGSPDSPTPQ